MLLAPFACNTGCYRRTSPVTPGVTGERRRCAPANGACNTGCYRRSAPVAPIPTFHGLVCFCPLFSQGDLTAGSWWKYEPAALEWTGATSLQMIYITNLTPTENRNERIKQYFEKVPQSLIKDIIRVYQDDFIAWGYQDSPLYLSHKDSLP